MSVLIDGNKNAVIRHKIGILHDLLIPQNTTNETKIMSTDVDNRKRGQQFRPSPCQFLETI